ncbi:MAG: YdeI/OmpD-associated family protein [Pseudomonadota bacterium]
MGAYHHFDASIEPLEWGRSTYTILRLPKDVAEALHTEGARRVEGELKDHPVNLGLARADVVDGVFLWTGKSLLDAADIAPGEVIEVRLRKADADAVDVPDDVALALLQNEAQSRWDDLTPGKQRGLLHPISTAKRPETRVRRIAKLIEALSA